MLTTSRFFNWSARSALFSILWLNPFGALGQSSVASYNGVHAIVGARIEIGDGRVIDKGTVVIKNGLIVVASVDAPVPRGADVLDGKGLTVYPGFIDAYTTKGYTSPAVVPGKQTQADPNADNPSYASAFMRETVRVGIRPECQAIQSLSLTDDLLKSYQSCGFTTMMVCPSGGDINGLSALVNLSGRPPRECVVLPRVFQSFGFGGNSFGDGYPSSLMGHIAQVRQALLDANWYGAVVKSFEAGGSQRPPADESLVALQSVVSGKISSVFDADTAPQIARSLNICAEFGLKPVIAGGSEAWKQINILKKSGSPVLVALAFGTEPGVVAPKPDGPAGKDAPITPTLEPENQEKVKERKRLYEESVRNASVLASAGIPIAFSSKGSATPMVFLENLRKAVKSGLSKDAALRALTIDAAKIFGVDRQLGTVEPGKIANVIVTSADFLDPKLKVKMLYIDGRKIDPERKQTPAAPRFRFDSEGGN